MLGKRIELGLTLLGVAALGAVIGCGQTATSEGKRIIIITNTNSPYWDTGHEGLKAAERDLKLKERGLRAEFIVNDGTPQGQIDQLRQFGTQSDIVAVGVSVTDAANKAIADEMKKLQSKGVHVLAIDGDLDRGKFRDSRFAFIGTDNLAAGRELGTAVRYLRPDGGEYVTFVGRTGAHNAIERITGFGEGAGPKFKAADKMGDETDRTRAKENVRNAITNHPGVNALVGIWSYNGPAIASVLKELGRRKEFTAVTFDAEPVALQQLAAGDLDCLIVQNPFEICYQGVRAMAALVENDKETVKTMFPSQGEPDGDLYITNLKIVIPDQGSALKPEYFSETTEFLTLGQFKSWLDKYGLKGIMSGTEARKPWAFLRGEVGLALAIVVVLGLTAALDAQHNYLHAPQESAIGILRKTSMLGIFALGSAIVIIAGGIDLSAGSMIAFGGTICSTLLVLMAPEAMADPSLPLSPVVITLAILGTLVSGFLIGSLHAWLITVVGVPPFIATLATLQGLRSLGRFIIENVTATVLDRRSTQIPISHENFLYLANSVWIPVVVFAVLAVLTWILMSRTVVGRHLYALGGNESATRLSGIRTDRLKWLAYCIGAMFSSIAGVLYIADQSVADPQQLGRGYELNAITAAVVGGCSLQGGLGTIPGTVLGCLFLHVVMDGVAKIFKTGADTYEGLIVGIVLVVAVAINQSSRKHFFPGNLGWVAIANLSMLGGLLGALLVNHVTGAVILVLALVAFGFIKFLEARRGPAQ